MRANESSCRPDGPSKSIAAPMAAKSVGQASGQDRHPKIQQHDLPAPSAAGPAYFLDPRHDSGQSSRPCRCNVSSTHVKRYLLLDSTADIPAIHRAELWEGAGQRTTVPEVSIERLDRDARPC